MNMYTQYEISRRDKQFYKKQFEKDWTEYYWNEFILKNEDKIDWLQLSSNSNKPWDWHGLSENLFKKNKERFMERKHLEHIAAFRIQCKWREANEDPRYELCRKRLNRDYNDLFEN